MNNAFDIVERIEMGQMASMFFNKGETFSKRLFVHVNVYCLIGGYSEYFTFAWLVLTEQQSTWVALT